MDNETRNFFGDISVLSVLLKTLSQQGLVDLMQIQENCLKLKKHYEKRPSPPEHQVAINALDKLFFHLESWRMMDHDQEA